MRHKQPWLCRWPLVTQAKSSVLWPALQVPWHNTFISSIAWDRIKNTHTSHLFAYSSRPSQQRDKFRIYFFKISLQPLAIGLVSELHRHAAVCHMTQITLVLERAHTQCCPSPHCPPRLRAPTADRGEQMLRVHSCRFSMTRLSTLSSIFCLQLWLKHFCLHRLLKLQLIMTRR